MREPAPTTEIGDDDAELTARLGKLVAGDRTMTLVVSADEILPESPLRAWIDDAIRKPIAVRAVLEAMARLTKADETRAA